MTFGAGMTSASGPPEMFNAGWVCNLGGSSIAIQALITNNTQISMIIAQSMSSMTN